MNRKSLLGFLIGLMVFLLASCSGVEGVPLTSEGMPPAGVLVIQLQPQK